MVCMSGHFKMASVLKLVMMENHATPDDLTSDKGAAQILHKQLFGAHEPNLLDEDDMHIFGSKPMADPLDLVCCNTCKKPIKASQYAVHAERCSSGKLNPNDSMGTDQKVHIKVKLKSQSENKNITNGFELDNGFSNKVQPIGSNTDQRLKTSANTTAVTSIPGGYHRDAPVPLATKMYHSQGNYRLRLELGQLYHQSCSEHSGSYSVPNSSQENGLMASHLSPRDNSSMDVAQKSFVPQMKVKRLFLVSMECISACSLNDVFSCDASPSMHQLLATTREPCPVIPQQVAASVPNQPQATKSQKTDVQVSTVKNEMARSRCSKDAVRHSKNTG
uniref:SAGA-associated factor 11 n=1 Tax=Leersia perrieri TaxID=77586 RepID=A0A0D9XZZ4_9ORYZ